MIRRAFLFLLFLLACTLQSHGQLNLDWIRIHGDSTTFTRGGIIVDDGIGHLYVGSDSIISLPSPSGFLLLLKYDYQGNLIWRINYPDNVNLKGLIVDSAHNIYICGDSQSSNKGIIIKYDSNGNLLWDKKFLYPSSSSTSFNGMAINGNNEIVIHGSESGGSVYSFLAFYNDSGNLLHVVDCFITPGTNLYIDKITADYSGNIILAGNSAQHKIFVMKFGSNDSLIFGKTVLINSILSASLNDFVIDHSDNIYLCARAKEVLYVNEFTLIVKYDPYGNMINNKSFIDSLVSGSVPRNLIIYNDTSLIFSATNYYGIPDYVYHTMWKEIDTLLNVKYSYVENSFPDGTQNSNSLTNTIFIDSSGQLYTIYYLYYEKTLTIMEKFSISRQKLWTQFIPDSSFKFSISSIVLKGDDNFFLTGSKYYQGDSLFVAHYQNQLITNTNSSPENKGRIFPIPFYNELNFELNTPHGENVIISIYNLLGVPVKEIRKNNTGINTINLSDLNSGIYIMNLKTKNRDFQSKIIKCNYKE